MTATTRGALDGVDLVRPPEVGGRTPRPDLGDGSAVIRSLIAERLGKGLAR